MGGGGGVDDECRMRYEEISSNARQKYPSEHSGPVARRTSVQSRHGQTVAQGSEAFSSGLQNLKRSYR